MTGHASASLSTLAGGNEPNLVAGGASPATSLGRNEPNSGAGTLARYVLCKKRTQFGGRRLARHVREDRRKTWAAIRETQAAIRETQAAIRDLSAAQKRTEASLRAFIDSLRRAGNGHTKRKIDLP
jgi:hypothetical protein